MTSESAVPRHKCPNCSRFLKQDYTGPCPRCGTEITAEMLSAYQIARAAYKEAEAEQAAERKGAAKTSAPAKKGPAARKAAPAASEVAPDPAPMPAPSAAKTEETAAPASLSHRAGVSRGPGMTLLGLGLVALAGGGAAAGLGGALAAMAGWAAVMALVGKLVLRA